MVGNQASTYLNLYKEIRFRVMIEYIYCLKDPNNEEIRYVGKTSNPESRYKSHLEIRELSMGSYKANWIKSLLRNNQFPYMEILEECTSENVDSREIFWIDFFRSNGVKLTNMTNGGEGGNTLILDETRKRHSVNTSLGLKGKSKSPEAIEAIRLSKIGKRHTQRHKDNIGNSVRGEKNGFFGKHHTDEFKNSLRNKFLGKPKNYTEEQKKLMAKTKYTKRGKYWGVSKLGNKNWWRVRIYVDGKSLHLGIRKTEDEAALLYNELVHQYLPDAPLNFIS